MICGLRRQPPTCDRKISNFDVWQAHYLTFNPRHGRLCYCQWMFHCEMCCTNRKQKPARCTLCATFFPVISNPRYDTWIKMQACREQTGGNCQEYERRIKYWSTLTLWCNCRRPRAQRGTSKVRFWRAGVEWVRFTCNTDRNKKKGGGLYRCSIVYRPPRFNLAPAHL